VSQITPRLADAKRALDAADRVRADGQALVNEGRQLAKDGAERIRSADPQYWTAARLVYDELSAAPATQAEVADMLDRPRSYISKLYSIGKTFRGRDPSAEGLSFEAAYRRAREASDYGIGAEKITRVLADSSLTQAEITAQTGLAQTTVSDHLAKMIREGTVQKAAGRPARYEQAPVPPVRAEHPVNQPGDRPQPGAAPAPGEPAIVQPDGHPDPRPQLDDLEGRRQADVQEIIRFVDGRICREVKAGRLVLTPAETRTLIDLLSQTSAALRDKSQVTLVPSGGQPDPHAVTEALVPLAKQLHWASACGHQTCFTDGATVWVIVAGTYAAIIRERNGSVTAHPSDVTTDWILSKAARR